MPPKRPAASSADDDLKVLDFRNPNPSILRRLLRITWGFVIVHYLFYGAVFAAILAALAWQGPLGILAAAVIVLAYTPSFLAPYQVRVPEGTGPRASVLSRGLGGHRPPTAASGSGSVTWRRGSWCKSTLTSAWYGAAACCTCP